MLFDFTPAINRHPQDNVQETYSGEELNGHLLFPQKGVLDMADTNQGIKVLVVDDEPVSYTHLTLPTKA